MGSASSILHHATHFPALQSICGSPTAGSSKQELQITEEMVVKAVSALKDANGSRLGAIVSYLQMEYKELQNQILASRFVRRISVQLKYATDKGKLVRCNRRYLIAGKGKNKLLESKAGGSKSVKKSRKSKVGSRVKKSDLLEVTVVAPPKKTVKTKINSSVQKSSVKDKKKSNAAKVGSLSAQTKRHSNPAAAEGSPSKDLKESDVCRLGSLSGSSKKSSPLRVRSVEKSPTKHKKNSDISKVSSLTPDSAQQDQESKHALHAVNSSRHFASFARPYASSVPISKKKIVWV